MNPPDTGLAAERTALAWRRTALAATVVVALLAEHAIGDGGAGLLPLAAGVVPLAVVAIVANRRARLLRHAGPERVRPARVTVAAATLAILVLAAVGVAVVGTEPWP
ncbi:DUF202 domain-containing protein [Nocardia farcinica]|uniref:DUF202 domain-containing protein n=1 Tax=Nocardia TaxID=1817 RepID=UPI000A3BB7DC|nr:MULTISPECIES: DUF202 domain-containing protein [Nocardia]MBA4856892.1 DUF202 domain-containing protein [Nocardia farcinica]MBC9815346.1 DUF202 domain-containing protein [Nocardia farcinica]MBF6185391.1 DUF202 domain-containing protein [Nocardia farcinica]MBF6261797.1 DUF202 domain-containing protein [Nocardia farcinica]MBF6266927.1 DUF202 domain-containing protein [Nocardia farcinica]